MKIHVHQTHPTSIRYNLISVKVLFLRNAFSSRSNMLLETIQSYAAKKKPPVPQAGSAILHWVRLHTSDNHFN